MESAASTVNTIVEQASNLFLSAQTEIFIFIVAFVIHAIFFRRLTIPRSWPVKEPVASACNSGSRMAACSRGHRAKAISRAAEHCCQLQTQAEVVKQLMDVLECVPQEDIMDVMAGVIEAAGKNSSAALCGAVREVLRARSLKPNVEVGERLLSSYFALREQADFDDVLWELEEVHGVTPSIGIMALKFAVRVGDFDASLTRLGCLFTSCEQDSFLLNSGVLMGLLQQLSRLSTQKRSLPRLLLEFKTLGILEHSFDAVVNDCVHRADDENLGVAIKFAKHHGVKLCQSAYAAMIKTKECPEEALALFNEVAAQECLGNDFLQAASEWAVQHRDANLVSEILGKLPPSLPPEIAGLLLRFHCSDGGEGANDADELVLRRYTQTFRCPDLSGDVPAMKIVAAAAVRVAGQRGDAAKVGISALTRLLQSANESAQINLLKSISSERRIHAVLLVIRATSEKSGSFYNAAMEACIDCRSLDDAQKIMAEAVQAGVADVVSYNTIVKAYLHAKRYQDARRAVASMKAAGLQPNGVTYNEFLDSMVKTNLQDAWPLLDEMRAAGVKPNRITCAILLKAVQARSSNEEVERTLAVIDEIEEDIDEVLLCSVVDACIRSSRMDLLMPILKQQRARGKTQIKGAHTYGSIIRAYGCMHDLAGAWAMWREMRTRHIPACSVALGCMVEALVTNSNVEAGYELIVEMRKDPQWKSSCNAVVYCSVLKGFSHLKKFDRLWQLYQEMLGHNLKFSIVTFNTLVDACARNGEMSRIPPMLEDMVSRGIAPNVITYSAIVKGYCQANRIDDAFHVVDGMMQTTTFKPDEIMYNTLLDGCARTGKFQRGMEVFERMEADGVVPTNFTLSVLVKLANRGQRLDKAFWFCEDLSTKYGIRLNVHVYSNLASACVSHSDLDRAFGVLEKMVSERVRPDVRTYTILLKGCVAAKAAEDAADLVRVAFGLTDAHRRLSRFDRKQIQPQGGLPASLVEEVLVGITNHRENEQFAIALFKDLKAVSKLKLNPKLQLHLATSVFRK